MFVLRHSLGCYIECLQSAAICIMYRQLDELLPEFGNAKALAELPAVCITHRGNTDGIHIQSYLCVGCIVRTYQQVEITESYSKFILHLQRKDAC